MIARSVLLAVSVIFIGLAVIVYHRAPDRVWNRIFAVHAFTVSGWVILNYLIQSAASAADATMWLRLTHPVVAIAICSGLDLAWVFPERIKAAPWAQRVVLYTTGLIVSTVALAPNLYTSVELAQGTVLVIYGWPFIVFGLFTMTITLWADAVLLRKVQRLTGLQRVQVIYMLIGLLIGQVGAIVTMVVLPLVWQNTYFSRWGPASYVFIISGMAYAIAKHHIVKPKVALYRTTAYLLTGAGVAPICPGHHICRIGVCCPQYSYSIGLRGNRHRDGHNSRTRSSLHSAGPRSHILASKSVRRVVPACFRCHPTDTRR